MFSENQPNQFILREQRNQPAYKRLKRKLRVFLCSLGLFTGFEAVLFAILDVPVGLYLVVWALTAILPWCLGLGLWIRPERKELREWRQNQGNLPPTVTSTLPTTETSSTQGPKRPTGLTIISVVWVIAGIANLYNGLNAIRADFRTLAYLSPPGVGPNHIQIVTSDWYQFGLRADAVNSAFVVGIGFCQIIVVSGLLAGRRWSYKGMLATVLLLTANWIIGTAIRFSAPPYLNIGVPFLLSEVVGSTLWFGIYLGYMSKPHVKAFLKVLP